MSFEVWLLVLILGAVAVPYVLGPVMIFLNVTQQAEPEFELLDLEDPPVRIPKSYFKDAFAATELGFEVAAHLRQKDQVPGVLTCLSLLSHYEERTVAIVVYMLTKNAPPNRYIEFATDFEDGVEIATNNTPTPGAFAKVPEKIVQSAPHVKGVSDLFRVHLAVIQKKATERKPLPEGREVEEMCSGMVKDLTRQVEQGYFRLDRKAGKFRPTVKGAVLMTWKLAWPVGMIRTKLKARDGRDLVRKLGIRLQGR